MSNVHVVASASASVVPSTGKQKYLAFKKSCLKSFGLDKDPDQLVMVDEIVSDVIDDLNSKKLWRFNLLQAADITTQSGTSTYSVPADLWRVYSLRKSDSVDYALTSIRERTFDILFQSQNNITGYPYVRADFNIYRDGTIKVFPVPDGSYTLTLRYYKLIPKPAADNQELDMPSPFQTMVKYGIKSQLAAFVEHDTLMRYWEGKYRDAYNKANAMDEEIGDEDLRFINIEELRSRAASFMNPSIRPRYYDFY